MMLDEIAAGLLATLLKRHLRHFRIAHALIQSVQSTQARNVGNGFNIEDESGIHHKNTINEQARILPNPRRVRR
jgi:hypothetical protein